MSENKDLSPEDIYKKASPEILKIIHKVLSVEKEYLYSRKPRGIKDEIIKIIKQEIK
ncbi:hypothetical protein ACFL2E_03080 [Thermodesulfobacteriota bacterium]